MKKALWDEAMLDIKGHIPLKKKRQYCSDMEIRLEGCVCVCMRWLRKELRSFFPLSFTGKGLWKNVNIILDTMYAIK